MVLGARGPDGTDYMVVDLRLLVVVYIEINDRLNLKGY